jgi:hypothetical protein
LFFIAAACEIADAHCSPAELSHQDSKVPVCAGGALSLWHLEDVHHGLRADALQAVEADFPAHALEPQAPRLYAARREWR